MPSNLSPAKQETLIRGPIGKIDEVRESKEDVPSPMTNPHPNINAQISMSKVKF